MPETIKEQLSKVGNTTTCPAAIVIKNSKVLMGFRHYTPDKWKSISVWTMPGGRCDAGETLEATLRREIHEEVGIDDIHIVDYLGGYSRGKRR